MLILSLLLLQEGLKSTLVIIIVNRLILNHWWLIFPRCLRIFEEASALRVLFSIKICVTNVTWTLFIRSRLLNLLISFKLIVLFCDWASNQQVVLHFIENVGCSLGSCCDTFTAHRINATIRVRCLKLLRVLHFYFYGFEYFCWTLWLLWIEWHHERANMILCFGWGAGHRLGWGHRIYSGEHLTARGVIFWI